MPYTIEKKPGHADGDYCVVKKTDGSVVKCHDTMEKAQAHMAAINLATSDEHKSMGSGPVSPEPVQTHDRDANLRWRPEEVFRREATTEVVIDAARRTCDLSFSSEAAVDRGGYDEVLIHDDEHMDLSRLNDSHPLLLNHDPEQQIGVVERACLDKKEKKGRATVRFSKSSLGQEVWQDVQDGIRRLVSVGYRRADEVSSEKVSGREVIRFAWQPYEVSIVSVPADASVGIGRNEQHKEAKTEIKVMSEENKTPAVPSYQKEAAEILGIARNLRGKVENVDEMANTAISEGKSANDFRAIALNKLPEIKPLEKPLLSEVKSRDWNRYSITRAINGMCQGKLDGLERELSDETSLQTGSKPSGFWVPGQVLSRANSQIAGGQTVTANTLGGIISEAQSLASEFVEVLRNRSRVIQLGARVLNLNSAVMIPTQYTAGSAAWVAETATATFSSFGLKQITLTPYAVSAWEEYSKQLLQMSNPSIDALVKDDINQVIALAIDAAALHGTGSSQPLGIIGQTSVNSVSVACLASSALTTTLYPFLVSLETMIAADNADQAVMAYLMRPEEKAACKTTVKFASTGVTNWEPGNTVNGYRAETTNQISEVITTGTFTTSCTAIFFGAWDQLLVAQFFGGATDLVVDPYTYAHYGVVRVIARRWVDCGVRHAEAFAVGLGLIA